MRNPDRTHTMAIFCDFENLAIGVRDARYDKFDMGKVLERLLVKGSIVVKKAYCDWDRYRDHKRAMHEAAFEMIEIPHVRQGGKNSADIRMVVDALDLCYTKSHVDTFVIVSGDSDFSPLVSKLRENNKTVIGVGVKNSTGDIFISNCDEFIFYDDLVRELPKRAVTRVAAKPRPAKAGVEGKAGSATSNGNPKDKDKEKDKDKAPAPARDPEAAKAAGDPDKAVELFMETVDAMMNERGGDQAIWASSVKQTIKRRQPQFSERYYGFRSFAALVEAAGTRGLIHITKDMKSGDYQIHPDEGTEANFGEEAPAA
ncbi:MAG: NYN domain-containing protein [Verrucomicrobiota bacterium]